MLNANTHTVYVHRYAHACFFFYIEPDKLHLIPNEMTTPNVYTVLFVCASKYMFMVSTIKVVSITLGHISSIFLKTTQKHFSLGTIQIL